MRVVLEVPAMLVTQLQTLQAEMRAQGREATLEQVAAAALGEGLERMQEIADEQPRSTPRSLTEGALLAVRKAG